MILNPHFVTDHEGRKTAVQLSVIEYECLIEALEMKADIALYQKVKVDKKENYMSLTEYLKERKNNDFYSSHQDTKITKS